ncbi:hypothetical protein AZE42_12725 [Rhizopogon vesiculosus]|uniref:Uncharacterized protein n=1 Tax=Rhizopogon vesiculosus TaxID=180088 RepID=A0A1J8QUS2_9AGAM|nr:hypothetical protein AZE42_12725 [Rhizopogon vesiculosus]
MSANANLPCLPHVHFVPIDQTASTLIIYDIFQVDLPYVPRTSPLIVAVDRAASTATIPDIYDIYEHTPAFQEAADALADECFLHCYKGVYYNIPASGNKCPTGPPFYVITRGRYIGVIAGENAHDCIVGVIDARYDEVETIALGEEKVREAIDKGIVETVTPCDWPECSTTTYENGLRTV